MTISSHTKTPAPDGFQQIADEFEFLEDWDDRYRYIIELGRNLAPMDEAQKVDTNKIKGCVSQVWLVPHVSIKDGQSVFEFDADSDAQIVKGLVYIALTLFRGQSASDITKTDAMAELAAIGLDKQISPQRSNGLRSLVERITQLAAAAQH